MEADRWQLRPVSAECHWLVHAEGKQHRLSEIWRETEHPPCVIADDEALVVNVEEDNYQPIGSPPVRLEIQ
jgi:uncharacterized protein (UPF0179 family)